MSNKLSELEQRRKMLVAECAIQRVNAAIELDELRTPSSNGTGFKLPLTIASVVLGMIATRAGGALPMLTAGLSLFKVVKTVLAMVRKPG